MYTNIFLEFKFWIITTTIFPGFYHNVFKNLKINKRFVILFVLISITEFCFKISFMTKLIWLLYNTKKSIFLQW